MRLFRSATDLGAEITLSLPWDFFPSELSSFEFELKFGVPTSFVVSACDLISYMLSSHDLRSDMLSGCDLSPEIRLIWSFQSDSSSEELEFLIASESLIAL